VSSIRLFILAFLADHGDTYGHQVRMKAEEEHVHLWTDISVGSVYGAMKRLATEGLIREVRVERRGNLPERQVYGITDAGRAALAELRSAGLREIWMKPDPFDLALTRLDPDQRNLLPDVLRSRLADLNTLLNQKIEQATHADPFLTLTEHYALTHTVHRLRAEITWLQGIIAELPKILAAEAERDRAEPVT
jgi:DNA-binding PadR family transcriptional regulator